MSTDAQVWQPTHITRFNKAFPTSACTVQVETDVGTGYLKAMGSNEGPHILACEWVGTRLAQWLGLSTFDYAQIMVTDIDEIRFHNGTMAAQGPAFITRAESGETWGGDAVQLGLLINPQDITRLVVLDTWTLNCDRFSRRRGQPFGEPRVNYGNVFLSEEAPAGTLQLKAMDHTHCFTCGRELSQRLADIDNVMDERVFGLFPPFRTLLDLNVLRATLARLHQLDRPTAAQLTVDIPRDWGVSAEMREALIDFLVRRARYLVEMLEAHLRAEGLLWEQQEIGFGEASETQQ